MTTPVITLGPADPKAPLAAKFYTVVSSLLGLITLAQTFHLLNADQAASLNGVGAAAVGMVGSVATAVAAFRTHKQVGNGTFDAAPVPAPPLKPEQQVAEGLKILVNNATSTTAALSNATQMAADVLGIGAGLPGIVGRVDDAISQVLGHLPPR